MSLKIIFRNYISERERNKRRRRKKPMLLEIKNDIKLLRKELKDLWGHL